MLLRFLSRFLGTDVRYLALGSIWLSLNKAASITAGLILSVAYARYLSKEDYGTYRYILSFIGIFGIFAIPGMGTAFVRSVARGYLGTFRVVVKTIFLSSFGISILCILTAVYFYIVGEKTLAIGLGVAALLVPFSEGLGAWRSYFTATKQFRAGTLLSSSIQLFYCFLMLGSVASIAFGSISSLGRISILVGTYLAAHAIPNILLTWRVWRRIPLKSPVDRQSINYGVRLSIAEIPSILETYVDSLLLFYFLDPSALAVFSFARAPTEQLKSIFGTVADVGMPKLAEKSVSKETSASLQKSLPRKLFRSSLFTACGVGTYILLAPFLFQVLFPRYIDAVPFTQTLALSLIFFPLGIFGTALKAEGNMKKIYIFSTISPLVQIVAMFLFIPVYGIWGAVAARVGGRLFHHVLLTYLYYH